MVHNYTKGVYLKGSYVKRTKQAKRNQKEKTSEGGINENFFYAPRRGCHQT